jgi:hypothetical protein
MTTSFRLRTAFLASLALLAGSCAQPGPSPPPITGVVLLDQGPNWTPIARSRFYSQDQGSDIMPLRWMQALKQPNGQPFLADSLGRYGYLPNPAVPGFPVGFSVANRSNETVVGMTCAACHTRQITVNNVAYRADGGPAIADFQSFLADLDAAVNSVLSNETPFSGFAQAVLGHPPTLAELGRLRKDVGDWFYRYNTLITRALPSSPWGPSRRGGHDLQSPDRTRYRAAAQLRYS